IPENNAIAISKQDGSLFAAAGDACAYCWDVESGKCKMTFKGHTDYLHSIAVREANHQGGNWIRRWDSPHLGLQKWEVYADDTSSTEQEN
uniref:Uncharacterized protein n=1 Tax=Aegilops tauschii subsp. strangulata TaxID=200361 RepID=A0A453KPX1_AEGTS